ncbi:ADP-ribosylglycohydrolase family protein [Domibacillus tundrae]|uniref:ADP-ribosylglycohydrolase family protein n=1 Tax=Domibacillus tundrae TaxID=1587527 RepID=UPI0006180F37|nr:ADP-ribosylglycohydrolase family protein [Domibacillus tundrae]
MKRKLIIILGAIFVLLMTVALIIHIMHDNDSGRRVAIGGIIVSALPMMLLFLKNNPFNIPIIMGYYVFLFCATFLGATLHFYVTFKWWDMALHFYAGLFTGFIGIALYKLFIPPEVRKDVSCWILFLFVLSLGTFANALWEIYEFAGDQTVTRTMQKGGNTDTMGDLLFGIAGGLLAAIYASSQKQKV